MIYGRRRAIALTVPVLLATACAKQSTAEPAEAPDTAHDGKLTGDLSPVDAPKNLIGLMRIHHPAQLADDVVAQSKIDVNWREAIGKSELKLLDVVDLNASIDAAATIERPDSATPPAVQFAFSLGIKSIDEAAKQLTTEEGMVEQPVDDQAHGHRTFHHDKLHCELAPARDAAARLVCAGSSSDDSTAALAALSPYLRRGLTDAKARPGTRMEFYSEPWRRLFVDEIGQAEAGARMGTASLTAMISDADLRLTVAKISSAVVGEVFALWNDADRLTLEGSTLEGHAGIALALHAQFRDNKSYIVRQLEAAPAGPPPSLFWALPADVEAAQYSSAAITPQSTQVLLALDELGQGLLRLAPGNATKKKRLSEAMSALVQEPVAQTVVASPPSSTPAADVSSANPLSTFMRPMIISYPTANSAAGEFVTRLVDLYNDRAFRRGLEQRWPEIELNELWKRAELRNVKVPASARLPKKSTLTVASLQIPSSSDPTKFQPVDVYVGIAQAPEHACIAWTFSGKEQVLQHLADCVQPPAQTLATREDLADLRTYSAMSAGFTDFNAMMRTFVDAVLNAAAESNPEAAQLRSTLAGVAIPSSAAVGRTVTAMQDRRLSISSIVPAGALESAASLIQQLVKAAKEKGEAATEGGTPADG